MITNIGFINYDDDYVLQTTRTMYVVMYRGRYNRIIGFNIKCYNFYPSTIRHVF